MSFSSDIEESFSLTSIEAGEIVRKSLALAEAFKMLRSKYSIDYLTESEEYAEKNKKISSMSGILLVYYTLMNRLSDDAKNMWAGFQSCEQAHQGFTAVCRMHSVSESVEQALTRALELAHDNDQLSQAEFVAEGRRLFESLNRAKSNGVLWEHLKI